MIMADYSFYELMNKSRAKTVLFIHFVFTISNKIFLTTKFTKHGYSGKWDEVENSHVFVGYGHTLCKMVIQEHPPHPGDDMYNDKSIWHQKHVEESMRKLRDRAHYCLAVVFTNLKILSSRSSFVNGFAWVGAIFSSTDEHPNIGIVTFANCKDPWNWQCILNFPHELGHSWGAPHDADSEECIPSQNGSYLMSFPFLDQLGPNNMVSARLHLD